MLTRFHASNLEHTVVSKTDTQGDWLHDMERVGLSQSAGRRCDPAAGESHRPTWEGATFMVQALFSSIQYSTPRIRPARPP